MKQRLTYAGFGILATLVGMAAGHLVASLIDPASSPVLAVGSTVIDLTPTPVKEWAVAQFGTADKPILVGSVMAGAAVLAAIGGILARRRFWLGASVLLLLVVVAAAAAVLRPGAGPLDAVPALATALTGVGALWWLTHAASAADREVESDAPGPSRRGVLIATGALAVAAAAMGGVGRLVTGLRADPSDVTLPKATDPAPAFPRGLEEKYPGIASFRTPTSDFYRIDTRLSLPTQGIEDYTLVIDGDVEEELTLTFQDLLDMDLIERDITLTCVSNDVGGPYVGGARWLGVRLTDLLDRAGVGGSADQILSTDVDGMTISTPLDVATDGRDAMIAVGMNGAALPREHGFPVRMVVPGLYGFVSACKWLTRMTLTTYDEQEAYWTERDWAIDAPIKISSRIDTPKSFEEIGSGKTFIGGVAWAQDRGIGKVEVQVDGGDWQTAELGPSAGVDYWRQWYLPWEAESGQHTLTVRAVSQEGEVQSPARAMPFPEGSSGYQQIIVRVG
ncbi:molybdopterin-dependent oxidoreductase [Nocardioides euryhalodurans]|uniref:Oxidoreductase n=1 Tax=Nocardioides euryhalodurans TaxID=2518370 RepID=A0A4P7GLT8_9ACTN|nr:molybdopterin-dependent oxidoreductase [Nocardioides euryhalodurans]QBR93066.1 oxidoreductase [Nocardioides euryhalodurans]